MLTMPYGASPVVALVGVDPGSDTLGFAVLRFNIETLAIVSVEARTLKGAKAAKGSWVSEVHGDRLGRIESHRETLFHLFQQIQPIDVASESPFFNRLHPGAYGPLMETIAAIRYALMAHDAWKDLRMIDPPTVKNAVGVKGNKGGKEGKALMYEAVMRLAPSLNYCGPLPIQYLDEHSIDAIAVAYSRYRTLLEELCLR